MKDYLTQPLQLQTLDFLYAILLGGGVGLWYDLLRGVRHICHVRKWWCIALFDLVFCGVVLVGLFGFVVLAIDSRLRIWTYLGLCGGGMLYFCAFSTLFYTIWTAVLCAVLRCCHRVIHFFLEIFKKYAKKASLLDKKEVQ